MNKEQKNIETCLAEDVLSEVANVPTDPQFVSLTDEALDPLKQQAAAQAGWDGYEKVVWTHKPYTFTSSVKQMKSNLILLLRRLWRFPFGRGTTASSDAGSSAAAAGSSAASAAAPIRSLADMWQHYITRLKGNPEYGIPSRLSQLTDLPSAPALLADRKISGVPEVEDGISMARILCDSAYAATITEIVDDNMGYTYGSQFPWSKFPNIKKAVLGFSALPDSNLQIVANYSAMDEFTVKVEEILIFGNKGSTGWGKVYNMAHLKRIVWKGLKRYETPDNHSSSFEGLICLCPELEEFIAEDLEYVLPLPNYTDNAMISKCGALKKVVVGTLKAVRNYIYSSGADSFINTDCPNLIHFEIGKGSNCSIRMTKWSPTNALDASRTDLIEEGSTAQNNLQQFLSNFRDYIAERLTDKGTGLTLTLSQEVRNAIHAAEAEYGIENIIITQKGWTISPAPN